jgi:uncharacterized membrane protein YtjA (UPF0391 family)
MAAERNFRPHVYARGDSQVSMFGWAVTFLVLSVVAAYFGFFGLSGLAAVLVKFLLIVVLLLLTASGLLSWAVSRRSSRHSIGG